MATTTAAVKRGDQFVHRHAPGVYPLFITVTRVARDQSWADIEVQNWACRWTKRQKLPITYAERKAWTVEDVIASEPS